MLNGAPTGYMGYLDKIKSKAVFRLAELITEKLYFSFWVILSFLNPRKHQSSREQQSDCLSHCYQLVYSKFIIFVCLVAVAVQLELQREVL